MGFKTRLYMNALREGLQIWPELRGWIVPGIPLFATTLLSIVSGVATATGIYHLTSEPGSVGDLRTHLFAILVTVALQLLMLHALFELKQKGGIFSRLGNLSMYLLCAAVSVTLGYSFWFQRMRAEDYSKELVTGQVEEARAGLARFGHAVSARSRSLDELARYSATRAEVEIRDGGTCGDASTSTRGPRARQREEDARLFESYARYFAEQSTQVTASLERLRSVVVDDLQKLPLAVKELRSTHEQLSTIDGDPFRRQIDERLRERLALGRGVFPGGFRCPDGTLEALLQVGINAELPPLPAKIEVFDPTDHKEIVELVTRRLTAIARALVEAALALVVGRAEAPVAGTAPATADAPDVSWADLPPLLLAALVDLLILVSGLAAPRRDDEYLTHAVDAAGQELADLTAATARWLRDTLGETGLRDALAQLDELRVLTRRGVLVPVPLPRGAEDAPFGDVRRLLQCCVAWGFSRFRGERRAARFGRAWRERHGAQVVELFEFDARGSRLLAAIARAVTDAESRRAAADQHDSVDWRTWASDRHDDLAGGAASGAAEEADFAADPARGADQADEGEAGRGAAEEANGAADDADACTPHADAADDRDAFIQHADEAGDADAFTQHVAASDDPDTFTEHAASASSA